jgi:branched-chain amino acid transport system substrate-binding protein
MQKKRLRLWQMACVGLLMFFLLANIAAFGDKPASTQVWEKELRIPLVTALTGAFAAWELDALRAVEMAADEINAAGGFSGRKLIVEKYDFASDIGTAAMMARRVAPNALFVIGPITSAPGAAAGPAYKELEVPALGFGSRLQTVIDNQPWLLAFATQSDYPAMMAFLKEFPKVKKVVVIRDYKDASVIVQWGQIKKALDEKGIVVLNEQLFATGDIDFSVQVSVAKGYKDADAIIVAAYPAEAGGLFKEIKKQGIDLPKYASEACVTPTTITVSGVEAAEGWRTGKQWLEDRNTPQSQAFVQRWIKRYPKQTVIVTGAVIYDSVYMFKRVFEQLKLTNDPSKRREERRKLIEGMKAMKDFEGVQGRVMYKPDGTLIPVGTYAMIHDGKFISAK